MNTELTTELARRAAVHAALADAARLAMVDALSLGDASPSELQAMLEMPSNLIAHHVKVLESAGLVARTRSEADRRRTYLTLVPGVLDGVETGASATAPRVVFVCTANTARSQLAAALWRRVSRVPVASAGTHPAERIDPGALAVARRQGVALQQRRPRSVESVANGEDLIVTVCDNANEELGTLLPARSTHLHWSVPDPVAIGTEAAFDATFADLTRRVDGLADRVRTA